MLHTLNILSSPNSLQVQRQFKARLRLKDKPQLKGKLRHNRARLLLNSKVLFLPLVSPDFTFPQRYLPHTHLLQVYKGRILLSRARMLPSKDNRRRPVNYQPLSQAQPSQAKRPEMCPSKLKARQLSSKLAVVPTARTRTRRMAPRSKCVDVALGRFEK